MFRGRPHTLPHPSRTLVLLVAFYVLHDRQDPVELHELNQGDRIQNSGSGACTASRRCGRAVVFHSLLGPAAQFNALALRAGVRNASPCAVQVDNCRRLVGCVMHLHTSVTICPGEDLTTNKDEDAEEDDDEEDDDDLFDYSAYPVHLWRAFVNKPGHTDEAKGPWLNADNHGEAHRIEVANSPIWSLPLAIRDNHHPFFPVESPRPQKFKDGCTMGHTVDRPLAENSSSSRPSAVYAATGFLATTDTMSSTTTDTTSTTNTTTTTTTTDDSYVQIGAEKTTTTPTTTDAAECCCGITP